MHGAKSIVLVKMSRLATNSVAFGRRRMNLGESRSCPESWKIQSLYQGPIIVLNNTKATVPKFMDSRPGSNH